MYKNIISVICLFLNFHNYGFTQEAKDSILYEKAIDSYIEKVFEESLIYIDSAISINPYEPVFFELKSDIFLSLKEFDKAGILLKRALYIFPEDPLIHSKFGDYQFFIGNSELAREKYNDAYLLASSDSIKQRMKISIASTKVFEREFSEAKKELLQLVNIENDFNRIMVFMELGAIEDELMNRENAIEYYKKAIQIDSTFVGGFMNVGFVLQKQNKFEKSYEYYENAYAIDSTFEFIYYSNQSLNLIHMDQPAKALDYINKSISANPFNSYAFRNKGLILLKIGDKVEACKNFEKAISLGFTSHYGLEVEEVFDMECK